MNPVSLYVLTRVAEWYAKQLGVDTQSVLLCGYEPNVKYGNAVYPRVTLTADGTLSTILLESDGTPFFE